MKYAYINGIILDGSKEMKEQKNKIVLTNGEKIEAIVENSSDITGYEIIDLHGQYLMPGLINLHVHLAASGKPSKKEMDATKLVKIVTSNALFRYAALKICESAARTQLMSGVTTIRTVGGILDIDTKLRDKINAGKSVGPRILASNLAISVEGGHMAGSVATIARSANEAASQVEQIAKDKPDWIKLMITGGVLDAKVKGEPGVLRMPAEYVKAACDKAHALGFKVAAHVESPEGVKVALENGVDSIEHGASLTPEMISLFKEKNASYVSTISPALPFALFDQSVSHASDLGKFNGTVVFEGIIEGTKQSLENDIPVGIGTDTGCSFVTHYNTWRELVYLQKYCGVSNAFALYTATQSNANIAGIGDITGSIETGKYADMIVTKNNPLENLQALRHIEMVVTKGKIIKQPKVKTMDIVDNELDKYL